MSIQKKRLIIALVVIVAILLIDQSLKIWVKTHMLLGEDSYLHWSGWNISWMRLHFVENPGMAFGFSFPGIWGKLFLSLFRIALVIVLIIILVVNADKYRLGFTIFLSVIIAGALGNLFDSAFYGLIFTESPYFQPGALPAHFVAPGHGYAPFLMGKVVDMLYFPLCNCHFPQWVPFVGGRDFLFFRPIFNIADSAIFIGVLGLFLFKNKLEYDGKISDNSRTLEGPDAPPSQGV